MKEGRGSAASLGLPPPLVRFLTREVPLGADRVIWGNLSRPVWLGPSKVGQGEVRLTISAVIGPKQRVERRVLIYRQQLTMSHFPTAGHTVASKKPNLA